MRLPIMRHSRANDHFASMSSPHKRQVSLGGPELGAGVIREPSGGREDGGSSVMLSGMGGM